MNVQRKPEWLRVKASIFLPESVRRVTNKYNLNTVCEEAACPNIHECWGMGTATFMILGNTCTRNCGFCNVKSGYTFLLDRKEPERVAEAVKELALNHAVITSVTRDDLDDGGASIFAETVQLIRKNTSSTIEVLIPDFNGSLVSLKVVIDSMPDILGHNIETVRRLYPYVRASADYDRSLEMLKMAESLNKNIITKTGLLLGFGEDEKEIIQTIMDIRETNCDIITIGQYLPPSRRHYPVKRYYTPEEFRKFELIGKDMGFLHVESGPLVRSSYHAKYPKL
ncbi:MAG: lipoyl synthase [Nitrospirota bacterium]